MLCSVQFPFKNSHFKYFSILDPLFSLHQPSYVESCVHFTYRRNLFLLVCHYYTMNLLLRNNQQLSTLTIRFATSITSNSTRKQNLKRQKLICHHDGSCVSRIYIYIYLYLSTRVNPLAPNGIYIYVLPHS